MTKVWFETGNRLEEELKSLLDIGIAYQLDEKLKKEDKILRIYLTVKRNEIFNIPEDKDELALVATYPDLYPYFRPEIFAYDLDLPRHQNPFGKNLCLLERNTGAWKPSWTVASFLKDQLPKLLVEGYITDPKELEKRPHEQAEPVSVFYSGINNPVVIFNSEYFEDLDKPERPVFLGNIRVGIEKENGIGGRFAVLKIADKKWEEAFYQMPKKFVELFSATISGTLFALPTKPPTGDAEQDFNWLVEKLESSQRKLIGKNKNVDLKGGQKLHNVLGICFPEEIKPGIIAMKGWVFIIHFSNPEIIEKQGRKKKIDKDIYFYATASKTNGEDFTVRIPQLKYLRDKKISIVGLGALGGQAAIEFAKSGVKEIRLLDFDRIEAATSVRWPLGLSVAGFRKTDVVSAFIQLNYPTTIVNKVNHRIGTIRVEGKYGVNKGQPIEQEIINQLYEDVDLLFDATAESGISHFLSQEAKSRNIPYVMIHATPGALGGVIMRRIPELTPGCWMCLQYAKADNTIPATPQEDEGVIQQAGCGDITFTGANFDLQNVTLAGVRMAISTLSLGHEDGYPDPNFDVGILKMVDAEKNPTFPVWEPHPLNIHPQCPYCNETEKV
ncbi:MAG: ThiF family adenylyltransferase [Candidatus Cyclobacteriaceae bacterium M2_1C_046]